ncbi:MAG: AAA family ATPase [Sedimentisphaerales bacterium]|nr:AAA family ATPase [Sedimentisphaerales bacterium]
MLRTIAVLNQKGGVGKTTTVANVASALAMNGQRVLVADLDPQAHLTIHLGGDKEYHRRRAYAVLTRGTPMSEAIDEIRSNLWLLGANIDLVGAESELVSVVGREIVLREALDSVTDRFDYLMIDCPPSLGLLTLNALTAVTEVFIPLLPHFLALQGLGKLLETVTLVNRRINPKLRITAILLCMFDKRTTLSGEVKADIEKFLDSARDSQNPWSGARIIPVHVRRNIKLAEAPSYGKTIFEYEPDCNGARDYLAIARFVHTQMSHEGVWTLESEQCIASVKPAESQDTDTSDQEEDSEVQSVDLEKQEPEPVTQAVSDPAMISSGKKTYTEIHVLPKNSEDANECETPETQQKPSEKEDLKEVTKEDLQTQSDPSASSSVNSQSVEESGKESENQMKTEPIASDLSKTTETQTGRDNKDELSSEAMSEKLLSKESTKPKITILEIPPVVPCLPKPQEAKA